jgi:hypothetical protein
MLEDAEESQERATHLEKRSNVRSWMLGYQSKREILSNIPGPARALNDLMSCVRALHFQRLAMKQRNKQHKKLFPCRTCGDGGA